ncbi:unnamed protein product [Adineta ricciae]|uniref:Transmembrane protein 161B-like n=1 Tax=Adineta ricciae TaxID=249248 RepID=A0A814F751_ADIRI|nr:unnamed protein product [Adineta ricciae]CAF1079209.1 unnamed protein product [Adineta ricciae]
MAIFGLQIVISLVVFCFLTKLTKYYSFGRWLLCKGLFRYWPPTNEEFKQAIKQRYAKESTNKSKKQANISKSYHKASSENNNDSNTTEEFPIPADTSIELKLIPIVHKDAIYVKYIDEFFSLVDFISGSIVIFLLTEIYLYIIPIIRQNNEHLNEINLSLFWCSISLLLASIVLTRFVREYLKVDEGILCILFGAFSFLLALCLQFIDERFFHFNLKETYGNRTIVYNDDNDEEMNYLDRRFIYIVMCLAVLNAYQSIILFFPAFRFGQLQYLFVLKNRQSKRDFKQILVFLLTIVNFTLPIFTCLLWLKPIIQRFDETHLIQLKIVSVIFCSILRICLFKPYMQIYLDTAFDRVKTLYEQQQSTSTRITNLSYQRNVTSIFLYLGVVTSQYILPIFIELIICFYLKVFSSNNNVLPLHAPTPPRWLQYFDNYMTNSTDANSSLAASWNEMRTLFSSQHFTVLISYILFWHHTMFCLVSCGSLIYNTYIQREQYIHAKND